MTARNLLGNLALDDTVAALRDLLTEVRNPTGTALTVSGTRDRFRDGFTTGTVDAPVDPDVWTLVNDAPDTGDGRGHLVLPGGDSQGAAYLRVSLSPFVGGSAVHLVSKEAFTVPIRHAWGISASQRLLGQEISFGLAEADDTDATYGTRRTVQPGDLAISGTVTITSNVGTITVPNHGLKGNDRIILVGNTAKQLNVGPVYTTVVDANTITVAITYANGTYTAGGYVRVADASTNLRNCALQVWGDSNISATTSTLAARRNGTKTRVLVSQGSSSSAPNQINPNPYTDAFLATGPAEIWANIDEVVWRSWSDGLAGNSGYAKFQQSIPDETLRYRLLVRARNHDNFSRPVARITGIDKTGTTTATVTTDAPHGLAVGDTISVVGVRDVTNFPTTTTTVASVPTATTFTAVVGPAATASSAIGGTVYLNQGGMTAPGWLTQTVQSLSVTAAGIMLVGGSATWTTVFPGDYVNVHGLAPALRAYEGAYKVLRISGTFLELAAPNAATVGTTNTGGSVIRRTDVRLHFARILAHTRLLTEVMGGRGNITDQNNTVPVAISSAPTLNVSATSTPQPVLASGQTTTALAANAAYTQGTYDSGATSTSQITRTRAVVMHAAGQVHAYAILEQSSDGTTFRETHRFPVPSDGGYHSFEASLHIRYWRWRVLNGATAQTAFYFGWVSLRGESAEDNRKPLPFPLTPVTGTALAISGQIASPTFDLGTNHPWGSARVWAYSDQAIAASGLRIDQSMDGTSWFTFGQLSPPGGPVVAELVQNIHLRYLRAIFTNGTTASTATRLVLTLLPV